MKYKPGDIHPETGLYLVQNNNKTGKGYWVTKEKYDDLRAKKLAYNRSQYAKHADEINEYARLYYHMKLKDNPKYKERVSKYRNNKKNKKYQKKYHKIYNKFKI